MHESIGRTDIRQWERTPTAATVGDKLAYRRALAHRSTLDVARADGQWTWQDVVRIEGSRSVTNADMLRYLHALAKADRVNGRQG